ncbi:MAG: hypothetical protein U0Q18_34880 [Bryobacteraceae bacterium]
MNQVLLKSVLFAAATCLSAAMAYPPTIMRFDVPFAFTAGDRQLPAGEYQVRWDPVINTILLERLGGESIFLPVTHLEAPPSPEMRGALRFQRYGDQFFLRGIQSASAGWRAWPASRGEKEFAKTSAGSILALLQR